MRMFAAQSGSAQNVYQFDAAGNVWNGAAFVAWVDANVATYRTAAAEIGTSGVFKFTEAAGAVWWVAATGTALPLDLTWLDDNARPNAVAGANGGMAILNGFGLVAADVQRINNVANAAQLLAADYGTGAVCMTAAHGGDAFAYMVLQNDGNIPAGLTEGWRVIYQGGEYLVDSYDPLTRILTPTVPFAAPANEGGIAVYLFPAAVHPEIPAPVNSTTEVILEDGSIG